MKAKATNPTKGLQRFTDSEIMINTLIAKDRLLQSDIDNLSEGQRLEFGTVLTQKLNNLKGNAHDLFIEKINDILPEDAKNQIWENNHSVITRAISVLMAKIGRMPTKNEIAVESGLSRQTVNKHLKGYAQHPLYAEQLQQFRFMADKVLTTVFLKAKEGDSKAARLYFDVIRPGKLDGSVTSIKTQNNYIQINGIVLSQESIKKLSSEQLNQIERIVGIKQ